MAHPRVQNELSDSKPPCDVMMCQPCCGKPLCTHEEADHEQIILDCGHMGCNKYHGSCIVCDSERETKRLSGVLLRLGSSKSMGIDALDVSEKSS